MRSTHITLFMSLLIAGIIFWISPYYAINPGTLSGGHEKLKSECSACHSPGLGIPSEKCLTCHREGEIGKGNSADVGIKNSNQKNFLLHKTLVSEDCKTCHTEHNGFGRENATLNFTHTMLNPDINRNCQACHLQEKPNTDMHSYSDECGLCHIQEDWQKAKFSHSILTDAQLICRTCHNKDAPQSDFHKTLVNEQSCAECHQTSAWTPATFNHEKHFVFDSNHQSKCSTCHSMADGYTKYTCFGCHEHQPEKIARKHKEENIQNFENCAKCHRSGDEDSTFNENSNSKRKKNSEKKEKHHESGEREKEHHEDD